MRVLVVRHHEEDHAGLIGDAFAARGATVRTHRYPADGPLPDADHYDHVVVLGAKWSVYDQAAVGAWIDTELDWLRRAVEDGPPVLGICFGAQLLTVALGGRVERAPVTEIGWGTVEPGPAVAPGAGASTPALPAIGPGPWFQFHSDRCLLPPAAVPLASNAVCVQAFVVGASVGVQFHPEIDAAQLQGWLDHGGKAEVRAAGIDPVGLLADTAAQEPAARRRADELVEAVLAYAERAQRRAG